MRQGALHVANATFLERSLAGDVRVSERSYAHATRRSLLVHEIQLSLPPDKPAASVTSP